MQVRPWARYGVAAVLAAAAGWAASDLRLAEAIKRRDHKAVISLLAEHADVNAAQPDGATALAWAAYLDDRESADLLLAAGASVKTADEYGETPLTLAAANGNAPLVEKLLTSGADANAARWDGETALMIAANAGSAEVVKQLIARGADVNAAESRKGQTALMWAAAEGHPEVVRVLIDRHADITAASKNTPTPSGCSSPAMPTSMPRRRTASRPWCLRRSRTIQSRCGCCWPPARMPTSRYPMAPESCWWPRRIRARWPRAHWRMAAPIPMWPIAAEIRRCTPRRRLATWSW